MSTPAAGPPGAPPTTAAVILDILAAAGVTTMFGLPGAHVLAVWEALGPGRPGMVGLRHEATAGFAADGLARASGGLGVVVTTSGPGVANAVAAFGEAAAAGTPLLLLASEVPGGTGPGGPSRGLLHESSDQGGMLAPLAKAVLRPTSPAQAVAAAASAVSIALAAPRGAVYVGVPADVLAAAAPAGPAPRPVVTAPAAADPETLDAAAAALAGARSPLVWAGGGVVAGDAVDALVGLAARLGAPVLTTFAARGLLAPGHPLAVDAPPHEPEVGALLAEADLLLVVGSALDSMTTKSHTLPRPDRLVAVNANPVHAARWEADVAVVGDAGPVCDALAVRLAQRDPWGDAVFLLGDTVRDRLAREPGTADAAAFLASVDTWPDRGVLVTDMAVAGYWVGGYARRAQPRLLYYPVGWGTLGAGLGAAIGAAHARRGPVLAVVGDGGLSMAVGDLASLVEQRLAVTVLLVDDAGYGMLRYDQRRGGLAQRGVDLAGPDWPLLAQAYGLPATVVSDPGAGLAAALGDAARRGGPSLVVLSAALTPPVTTTPRWPDGSPSRKIVG